MGRTASRFLPTNNIFMFHEGHGRPDGSVWKYRAGTDTVIKYTSLGMFPATTDITPDGNFIYVANANFHGDMVPSSISVVATDQMIEVKRIPTCTMPHGSRLNHAGTKHYSVCMMDDMLVEIDARKFAVDRYFMLAKGKEMGMSGTPFPTVCPWQYAGSQDAGTKPRARRPGRSRRMTARLFTWPAINRTRLSPSTLIPGLWRADFLPEPASTTWP